MHEVLDHYRSCIDRVELVGATSILESEADVPEDEFKSGHIR